MDGGMIGKAIYIRVSDRKWDPMATRRGSVLTQSWRGGSAVFRVCCVLAFDGSGGGMWCRRATEESRTSCMLVICYLFCVCMSVKSSTELMLYVVLTMPTLNKAYLLFIYYLFII